MIYSRELGLSVVPETKKFVSNDCSLNDGWSLYQRLKGAGKTKLFFKVSERSIQYLNECLGHDNLSILEVSDDGKFRDFLLERGMPSSSVKRIFSSMRAIVNLATREYGIAANNVFSGTYIPDDGVKQKRQPILLDVLEQIRAECQKTK